MDARVTLLTYHPALVGPRHELVSGSRTFRGEPHKALVHEGQMLHPRVARGDLRIHQCQAVLLRRVVVLLHMLHDTPGRGREDSAMLHAVQLVDVTEIASSYKLGSGV